MAQVTSNTWCLEKHRKHAPFCLSLSITAATSAVLGRCKRFLFANTGSFQPMFFRKKTRLGLVLLLYCCIMETANGIVCLTVFPELVLSCNESIYGKATAAVSLLRYYASAASTTAAHIVEPIITDLAAAGTTTAGKVLLLLLLLLSPPLL